MDDQQKSALVDAAPEILDLLLAALPDVEEAEQFNKPTRRTLSKRIRAMLAQFDAL